MGWHLEVVRDDIRRDMESLAEGFDFEMIAQVSGKMTQLFVETNAKVHVLTGKLKASGSMTGTSTPRGIDLEIRYGAPLAPYAVYEKARKAPTRGNDGNHDFMSSTRPDEPLKTEFRQYVFNWLRRRTYG